MRAEDADDIQITLDNGQSLSSQDDYLYVQTHNADTIVVYIDDGTTGSTPAEYDMIIETRNERSINDWMFDNEFSAQTARSFSLPAPSNQTRIDVTNVSGTNGEDYRIYAESLRGY